MSQDVERFLKKLGGAHEAITAVFKNGGCYELYLALSALFPEAEAWVDDDFHVKTKIGEFFYDIDGRHARPTNGLKRMDTATKKKARLWIGNNTLDDAVKRTVS